MDKMCSRICQLEIEISVLKGTDTLKLLAEKRANSLESYRLQYERQNGNIPTDYVYVEGEDMIG